MKKTTLTQFGLWDKMATTMRGHTKPVKSTFVPKYIVRKAVNKFENVIDFKKQA